MIHGVNNKNMILDINMKEILFVTTFSKSGYYVYGRDWIRSFLEFTKTHNHISAKVYVNGMELSELDFGDSVNIVDFDQEIPAHSPWVSTFKELSIHDSWNKDLAIKFSYKSFVMINELKQNSDKYVIWLDADSIFKSYNFDNFPGNILNNQFMAIQREQGSEHCESGVVVFDTAHPDKNKFVNWFESQYQLPDQYNSYGQFFDGYALYRTIVNTGVDYVDLNAGYGIGGIQSDPDCTFLNPELRLRFYHNIGITGKRNYQNWEQYVNTDPMSQLIHGVHDAPRKSLEEVKQERLGAVSSKISRLKRR